MRKFLLISSSVLAMAMLASSCNKEPGGKDVPFDPNNVLDGAVPTGYYAFAQMSVPAATDKVYIEYTYQDGSTRTIEQAVSPIVTVPTDGKDVEPFGTVTLRIDSDKPTKASVYYKMNDATKADGDDDVYAVSDLPIDQYTSGLFGVHRYVQVPWNFAYDTQNGNAPTFPKDVVLYDEEHNHTLRYKFAYAGGLNNNGVAYFLDDAYVVENYQVVGYKYSYCGGCVNCAKCMPWGCSCGCGSVNLDFVGNGDGTGSVTDATVVDTSTPGTTPTADGEGTATVGEDGSVDVDYTPTEAVTVQLPEPAYYVTTDEDYTMYHSSGVVMFDDRWPNMNAEGYRYDFNDMVVDYDIEALTVADAQLEDKGWREQVKVVLHVRALGGNDGNRVGIVLENFNTDNVDYVDSYCTLDSWQNAHGKLPEWTETTLNENSLRYDGLKTVEGRAAWGNGTALRPAFEIGRLQALNDKDGRNTGGKTSGNEVYQYNGNNHVFNPARRQYPAWQTPDADQYSGELDALYQTASGRTLANVQNMKLYNTIPGFVNVAGGLYTFTVIYHMKPRAEMSPEESDACKANMIETVVNTTNQNFFLVKGDYGAVGLKGYQPLDCAVKDYSRGYKAKYDEIVAAHAGDMDQSTTYKAKNGMVWGFKCPTLTRHTWELMPFNVAYPHYEEWVNSNGAVHADWYKEDVNYTALTCEW